MPSPPSGVTGLHNIGYLKIERPNTVPKLLPLDMAPTCSISLRLLPQVMGTKPRIQPSFLPSSLLSVPHPVNVNCALPPPIVPESTPHNLYQQCA
jgi:hypothetical protein